MSVLLHIQEVPGLNLSPETSTIPFPPSSGVPRNFVRVGFNKFSWGQRTERMGIWGSSPL